MSYSPFGNSFQWELVFYRKQSIHFSESLCCIGTSQFISVRACVVWEPVNSFQWDLVLYRNLSIHFFSTWFDSFLSVVGFHWVQFTNSLVGCICPLRSFLWASLSYNLSHSHAFFYYCCFELSRGFPFICLRYRLA